MRNTTAPNGSDAAALGRLVGGLASARRRILVLGLAATCLGALAAGLATVALLSVAARWAPVAGEPGQKLQFGLAVTALVLLAGVVRTLRGLPSQADLAIRADRAFSAEERLSTAIEVAARPATGHTALSRALIGDAAARASDIDAARLVPARLSRAGWTAAAVAVVAGAWLLFPPPSAVYVPAPDTDVPAAGLDAALTATERLAVSETLRAEAARVTRDPDAASDTYVQALMREVDRVGQDIAAGTIVTREDLGRELERLLSHAGGAGPGTGGAGMDDLSRLVGELLETLASGTTMAAAARASGRDGADAGAPPQPGAEGGSAVSNIEDETGTAAGDRTDSTTLSAGAFNDRSEPRFEQQAVAETCLQTLVDGDDLDCVRHGTMPEPQGMVRAESPAQTALTSTATSEAEKAASGFVIGSSERSGEGDSALAGRGSQELDGGRPWLQPDESEFNVEVALDDRETLGEAQRIRLNRPPPPDATAAAPDAVSGDSAGWRRLAERETGRDRLDPGVRDVVARYFKPGTEWQ